MSIWLILLVASGIVPLARTIWANRRTTLLHALAWGVAAWAAWLLWLAATAFAAASRLGWVRRTRAGSGVAAG